MSDDKYFSLGKWVELADDAYLESRELMYKKITAHGPLHVPAFLLHWSVELYLKSFLMQNEKSFDRSGAKGHDLAMLFNECLKLEPSMENLSKFNVDEKEGQSYWINLINEYGSYQGGVRYLNRTRRSWSFFVLIHDRLDDLVGFIKSKIDMKKDITDRL